MVDGTGSVPVAVYKVVGSDRQKQLLNDLSNKLDTEGYRWYVDFFIEWGVEPIELEIYREDLIPIVKEFIVEESI